MSPPREENEDEARWLLSLPERPHLQKTLGHISRKVWTASTGAAAMLGFTLVQISGSTTTWRRIAICAGSIVIVLLVVGVLTWILHFRNYIRALESRLTILRRRFLAAAGVKSDAPTPWHRFGLLQITRDPRTGALQIAIENPAGTGLVVGSKLSVVFTSTNFVYGTVVVHTIFEAYAIAVPNDRAVAPFWENLEDRADTAPKPPDGFHLEVYVAEWSRRK